MRDSVRSALKTTYSPFLDRARLTGEAAVIQMADDLIAFAANCGSVAEDELELAGWTPEQLAAHGKKAARLARQRAERVRL